MNRKESAMCVVVAGLLAFTVPTASAAPIYFAGTDHYYELVEQLGLNWDAADTAAQAKSHLGTSGYLAVITSEAENTFITTNLLGQGPASYWLGGFQLEGTNEPGDNWQWGTAEAWTYTNWHTGEPNDHYVDERMSFEDRLEILVDSTAAGKWNDQHHDRTLQGYVVEYLIPEPVTLGVLLLGGLVLLRWRK